MFFTGRVGRGKLGENLINNEKGFTMTKLFWMLVAFLIIGCGGSQSTGTGASSGDATQAETAQEETDPTAENAPSPNRTKEEVQTALQSVALDVKACGNGVGMITLEVVVEPGGDISRVTTVGEHAGTEIGACSEAAVRKAQFGPAADKLTVKYPYKF